MANKIPQKELPRISTVEWEKIVNESNSANKILNSQDFVFLLDYLNNAKSSCIDLIAHNSVKDVLETIVGENGYSKTIKTSKEEQLNELAGQIKFIEKLFLDLETFSKQKSEYEKMAKAKQIIIDVVKEDDR